MLGDILRNVQRRIIKSAARGYLALTEPLRETIEEVRQDQAREAATAHPTAPASKPAQARTARSSASTSKRPKTAKQKKPAEAVSSTVPKKRGRKPRAVEPATAKRTRVAKDGREGMHAVTQEPAALHREIPVVEHPVEANSPRTRKTRSPRKSSAKRSSDSPAATETAPQPVKRRGRPRKSEILTPQAAVVDQLQAAGDELGAAQVLQQDQTLTTAEALVAEHVADAASLPKTRARKGRPAKKQAAVSSEGAEKAERSSGRRRGRRKKSESTVAQAEVIDHAEASGSENDTESRPPESVQAAQDSHEGEEQ